MAVIELQPERLTTPLNLDERKIIEILETLGFPAGMENEKMWIEVTPNRPDMLDRNGIIRAIKAYITQEVTKYASSPGSITIEVKKNRSRPFIAAAVVKGVELDQERIEELMQFQEKLHDTLGRKRKKVAIGLHDLGEISGNLIYQPARGERFVPLGESEEMTIEQVLERTEKGKAYAHLCKEERVVIVDEKGVISFPPILNSERTKVKPSTTEILIEATGTNQAAVEYVVDLLACTFIDDRAKVERVKIQYIDKDKVVETPELKYRTFEIEKMEITKLSGIELELEKVRELLKKMAIESEIRENKLLVSVPPYRADVMDESDIVEDVLIAFAYNNVKPQVLEFYQEGKAGPISEVKKKAREILVRLGYNETVGTLLKAPEPKTASELKVLNPYGQEVSYVRRQLWPSLLKAFVENKVKKTPVKLFEVGFAYVDGKEQLKTCVGVMDPVSQINELWADVVVFYDVFGNKKIKAEKTDAVGFIRANKIVDEEGQELGIIGEIHPNILRKYNLNYPVVVWESALPVFSFGISSARD